MAKYSTEIRDGQVTFTIGVQTFTIDYDVEDERGHTAEEQLEWMRQQIEHALSQLGEAK